MVLTVIIINYNVRAFLEECLRSVQNAIEFFEEESEVIVVDNNSQDGSMDVLPLLFPKVKFIGNEKNIGFARANNQALALAQGEFVLFLNPDTLLPQEIFKEAVGFFRGHSEAGAIGVRMVNGKGRFLKESKRGLPTAWRSFARLSGLSTIFPHINIFSGYYAGHIREREIKKVEVLAGAFMMVRRIVLNETGGFDERFFMYAEDIDLSKRISEAGFQNFYLGNLTIVHFKGGSTKKDQQYVNMFYGAMLQYVEKHYKNGIQKTLIRTGIHFRQWIEKVKTTLMR